MFQHLSTIEKLLVLERYEEVGLHGLIEDLVIESCVKARFISRDDVSKCSSKFKWVQNTASYAINSYALNDEAEGRDEVSATLSSFDEFVEFCQSRTKEVLEFVSDKALESAPYLEDEEGSAKATDNEARLKLKGPNLF
ncbi:hypothetical protein [Vibrio paucivorans]|uniref:Uncharacterized protein n=1 Tax=Vibrio paucivorans TaxID=2829489 RepID=A0A9X3CIQ8_9VIBR|nr:hypothetical protein [Vibrio paucivorans]MCW8336405.1 hypothetical protein [Vibrio paucivorans]